jgi:hypothetical protein
MGQPRKTVGVVHLRQDRTSRTAWTGGLDRTEGTGLPGDDSKDRTVAPGQGRYSRTAGEGQLGQNTGTGQPGQDSRVRTSAAGQSRQDIWDRNPELDT